jgi:cytidine deaminase
VGAAMRSKSGRVYAAVHIEAYVARLAVCAEAIVIGMAAAEGDAHIDTIVAVRHTGNVASPCGMCREIIADYGPDACVIVPGPAGDEVVSISQLLPNKYRREEVEI